MQTNQQPSHLDSLDGLRGLMALWVVAGHTCHYAAMKFIPMLRSPNYAVDGFMILSGFLMTYHYYLRAEREPWGAWRTWSAFYIRRYWRISPIYYLLLIPALLFNAHFMHWAAETLRTLSLQNYFFPSPPVDWHNILMHVSYIFGLSPDYHASLVLPDWSLSLEMQFYLAFPFLMLFIRRFGWIPFLVFASGIWLTGHFHFFGYIPQFHFPSALWLSILWFAIGMLWAGCFIERRQKLHRWILLGAALSVLSLDPHDIAVVTVFAWVLFGNDRLAFGPSLGIVKRLLSGRVAKFLADCSYSVYLIHLLILIPVSYVFATRFTLHPVARWCAEMTITVSVTYTLAAALRPLEEAGIGFGKRLASALLKPAVNTIAVATTA